MEEKRKILNIYHILSKEYPQAHIRLNYSSPFELLVSAILAGQSSEDKVNPVTEELFNKYPSINELSKASPEDIEEIIKSTSVYKGKAQSIISISKMLIREYNNKFPDTVEKLTEFPGVGQRTAKLVLANCFYYPAILVDSYFKRVAKRVGITKGDTPDEIEADLMAKLDENKWTRFSLTMAEHGRDICLPKSPKCLECKLFNLCEYAGHQKI